jgi:isoleucyl-tRNA synthetase
MIPAQWENNQLAKEMEQLREVRSAVTSALEKAREKKEMTSSLQAAPIIYLTDSYKGLNVDLLKEAVLTSDITVQWCDSLPKEHEAFSPEIAVQIQMAPGEKCQRCWKVLPEVRNDLCARCAQIQGI